MKFNIKKPYRVFEVMDDGEIYYIIKQQTYFLGGLLKGDWNNITVYERSKERCIQRYGKYVTRKFNSKKEVANFVYKIKIEDSIIKITKKRETIVFDSNNPEFN